MPRKRSRLPKKSSRNNRQTTSVKKTIVTKKKYDHKKLYTAVMLIGIFCLVLFFNSYFNYTSGIAFNPEGDTIGTKFYLSGPDPYYNMRLCEQTLERGYYPFVGSDADDMLNYPVTKPNAARPPLFNMIAVGIAKIGGNFMAELEALGWAMLFLPAIYGALLIFPIYGIGKELFNKKVGLIAALFVPLIPAHIGAGHGSSFSLFDHDSFILLLIVLVIYFFIKSLKEKDLKKSITYAVLSGICVGAMELSWVTAEFIFVFISLYMVVQLFFDILQSNINRGKIGNSYKSAIVLCTGFLIALPYIIAKNQFVDYPLYAAILSLGICAVYYIIKKLDTPWTISIPSMFGMGCIGLIVLYFVHIGKITFLGSLNSISNIIFGTGIYGQQVSLTIAEAHSSSMSYIAMSFGPMIFWLAMAGFILFAIHTYTNKWKPQNILFLMLFIVNLWFLSIAGRFINDLIPTITIFAAYLTYSVIEKIDYKLMIKNIRSVSGGLHKIKTMKISHVGGIIFVACLLIPNSFCSLDAAVPGSMKNEVFGEGYRGAWGLGLGQQVYWSDACNWLSQQDTEIENPADRPGFISWWDYGFYEASMGGHPTVADNFQSGIPTAANFHTAKTENDAVSVLIIRLIQGKNSWEHGELIEDVELTIEKYLGNKSIELMDIIKNSGPSCNTLVAPEWGNTELRVSRMNSIYHDGCDILSYLTDEEITMFYHDMMDATGYSIRYYGVESYDTQIFTVFSFLSGKGTFGYINSEDDYMATRYIDSSTNREYTIDELNNMSTNEIENMNLNPVTRRKEGFFNTMFFKVFYGFTLDGNIPQQRYPTYGLKHFVPVYFSPYVIISKYYEGAKIYGTINFNNTNISYTNITVFVTDDLLGMPHDVSNVNLYGQFGVIAPAGNISLIVYDGETELDRIVFNTDSHPPITEEEAMRIAPDYNRTVVFNI